MTKNNQINRREGLINGLVDSLILRTFWDSEITTIKKDTSYLCGSILAGTVIIPGNYLSLTWDIIKGNYDLRL